MAKRGLGRGLGSLIPSFTPDNEGRLDEIDITQVVPNKRQPRKYFDQEALEELVLSIGKHGVVQPIVVRPIDMGYEIIAGERRWRAAKEAGLKKVPAVVRESDDLHSLEIALIENLQRENLNAIEEAEAYRHLIQDFKMTQMDLADQIGKSRTAITNTLRLLQLQGGLKEMLLADQLSSGHARALLSLDDQEAQMKLAHRIIEEGLSVRQTESMARLMQVAGSADGKRQATPESFKAAARRLRKFLGTKVKVKLGKNKGKVEIEFKSEEELERILALVIDSPSD